MKMMHQFMLAIFLPTFLTCLIITSFTGFYLIKHIENTTTQSLENQMQSYAIEIEKQLEWMSHSAEVQRQYVEETINFEAFKNDLSYREMYLNQLLRVIVSMAQQEPFQGGYTVTFVPQITDSVIQVGTQDFDGNGSLAPPTELSISYFTTETSDPSKDWFFKPLKSGEVSWTGPSLKKNGLPDHQYMTISLPIYYKNQTIGVTSVDYDFDSFAQHIENFQFNETGYAAITDLNHRFLLHPRFAGDYLNAIENQKYKYLTDKIETYDSGIVEYRWFNNEDKVLAFKHLSNSWTLLLTSKKSEVLVSMGTLVWVTLGLFLIAVVISFFVAGFLGKWTTAPIVELNELFSVHKPLHERGGQNSHMTAKNDDITDLANSIYQLSDSQHKMAAAIHDYNNNLGSKIDERNKDLLLLNQHLNESRNQLEQQQFELRQKNRDLEESIEEIISVQKQLIHSDKIASFGYIVTGIAEEIDIPVGYSATLVHQMSTIINGILSSEDKEADITTLINDTTLKLSTINQDLLRNLYFTKDIIDYIKDIVKSKSQQRKLPVVLKEALVNSANSAISLTNKKDVKLIVHCPDQLVMLSDPGLFSHILFSIFTTLLYETVVTDFDYFMTAKVISSEDSLKIVIYDNAEPMSLDRLKDSSSLPLVESLGEVNELHPGVLETRHLKMGFNMIYILMTEFFKGDFKVSQQHNGRGNSYTLTFYDVTYV